MLAACATPADRLAAGAGFRRSAINGVLFQHLLYFKDGAGDRLHVYIDHDGSPWLDEIRVTADPTPRDPLALRLMTHDSAPVLYLGRPCHYGLDGMPPCQPLLWTHARYGEAVVASMAAGLARFLDSYPLTQIVLIGYSGGGTLAVLLAERVPQTIAVVTVAGNLDVAAWAKLHDYTPLEGSLDPAMRPPPSSAIRQIHYVGSQDTNVPPCLARGYADAHPGAQVVQIDGFDHRCCWEKAWEELLYVTRFW
jgi:pimeloyl-ACP methyl ester carboxylesterase